MSQTNLVLLHLKRYGSITSTDAFMLYGCTRLASIIYNLRSRGHNIETIDEQGVNRFGTKCRYARYVAVRKDSNEVSGN